MKPRPFCLMSAEGQLGRCATIGRALARAKKEAAERKTQVRIWGMNASAWLYKITPEGVVLKYPALPARVRTCGEMAIFYSANPAVVVR